MTVSVAEDDDDNCVVFPFREGDVRDYGVLESFCVYDKAKNIITSSALKSPSALTKRTICTKVPFTVDNDYNTHDLVLATPGIQDMKFKGNLPLKNVLNYISPSITSIVNGCYRFDGGPTILSNGVELQCCIEYMGALSLQGMNMYTKPSDDRNVLIRAGDVSKSVDRHDKKVTYSTSWYVDKVFTKRKETVWYYTRISLTTFLDLVKTCKYIYRRGFIIVRGGVERAMSIKHLETRKGGGSPPVVPPQKEAVEALEVSRLVNAISHSYAYVSHCNDILFFFWSIK